MNGWKNALYITMATVITHAVANEFNCFSAAIKTQVQCFESNNTSGVSPPDSCSEFLLQLACIADHYNSTVEICRQQIIQLVQSGTLQQSNTSFNPTTCPCTEAYVRVVGPCQSSLCSQDGASCLEKVDISDNTTVCCVDIPMNATEAPDIPDDDSDQDAQVSGTVVAIIVVIVTVVLLLVVVVTFICIRGRILRTKRRTSKTAKSGMVSEEFSTEKHLRENNAFSQI